MSATTRPAPLVRPWPTPHWRVASVLELSGDQLCGWGLSALLIDLDGTLKGHYAPELSAEFLQWIDDLRTSGIRPALVSNGSQDYVAPFAGQLPGVPVFARARKPLPQICRRAIAEMGVSVEQAGIVGDQLFTDVLAGRFAGLFTILVPPLSRDEPWHIRMRRPVERVLLGPG